ncbi:hypothetical protein BT63DRAFT_429524 [Microthyrium microscopicum]|uniref:Uncharacterized protein n=1 Tax=Microthyrium microscopicum TaxID=703497 RepID=A0A6A6U1H7_9PEZI|nr:hypothetical protein BT63DRAFT_429524 [Microthyrium microscopicum]
MAEATSEVKVCERVGEPDPDIAGIGILMSFAIQALCSIVLAIFVFFLSKLGRLQVTHEEESKERDIELGRLRIVSKMLMVGNDTQLLIGGALIITALSQAQDIDLYHLHLIYDTAALVGVGSATCMASWSWTTARVTEFHSLRGKPNRVSRLSPRHRAFYSFIALFIALVILLGVRLGEWNVDEDGHCYRTNYTSSSGTKHPFADKLYLGLTAPWLIIVMILSVLGTDKHIRFIIGQAIAQFPVHLYFMIAMRSANSGHLEGEESEDDWRFGQTVAVILLAVTLQEMIHGFWDYIEFEKKSYKSLSQTTSRDPESHLQLPRSGDSNVKDEREAMMGHGQGDTSYNRHN